MKHLTAEEWRDEFADRHPQILEMSDERLEALGDAMDNVAVVVVHAFLQEERLNGPFVPEEDHVCQ